MFAEPAAEGQPRGILEADLVRDLAFERGDLSRLVASGRGGDGIFLCVEAEAFRELDSVGAGDRGAETFDRGEDLLV